MPKTNIRKLVNGGSMDAAERRSASETESFLKGELDRLHQELRRRVGAAGSGAVGRFLRDQWVIALGSAIIGGLVVALVLYFAIGIGRGASTAPSPAASRAAVREVYNELVGTDVDLERVARTRIWFAALPIETRQWESQREVLAATLPLRDWQSVADFYALAALANNNPQGFAGGEGKGRVAILRQALRPALATLQARLK